MANKRAKEAKKTFTVCMLPSMHNQIIYLANKNDMTISEYIISAVNDKIAKEILGV